jgi:hypothetical protein
MNCNIDAQEDLEAGYTRTDPIEKAAELGLVAFLPAEDELQLDLDTEEDVRRFDVAWPILSEHFPTARCFSTPSKSGDGQHVRIRVPFSLTTLQRIAFQAALGSDYKRELLAAIGEQLNIGIPTVLFETPAVAEVLKMEGWACLSSTLSPTTF